MANWRQAEGVRRDESERELETGRALPSVYKLTSDRMKEARARCSIEAGKNLLAPWVT